MPRELIIYADESISKGVKFSDFFGGSLVRAGDLEGVNARLIDAKGKAGLNGEVKWSKVSAGWLDRYKSVVDAFFDEIENGHIKTRVMFLQNRRVKARLTKEQRENSYFLLYYQFIKHAFGLWHSPEPGRLRLIFDELPETREKKMSFRSYLAGLSSNSKFKKAGIFVDPDIAEVDSKKHVVLQCTDVVMGAMQFRLNDLHRAIPPGSTRRGRLTVAKESLYGHVRDRICKLRPLFNIGITTGHDGNTANRWHHPYRHWKFEPRVSYPLQKRARMADDA